MVVGVARSLIKQINSVVVFVAEKNMFHVEDFERDEDCGKHDRKKVENFGLSGLV